MNFLVAKEESLVEFYGRYSIKPWYVENKKFNKSQIKKAIKKAVKKGIKGKDQF